MQHYTKIKNDIIEALCKAKLNGTELSLCLFIIRKTYGWNKKEDCISIKQMQDGTGATRSKVCLYIKRLLVRRIIKVVPKKGLVVCYAFNKAAKEWGSTQIDTSVQKGTKVVSKKGLIVVSKKGPTKDTTKDTIQKKGKFIPPTIEDIKALAKERGYTVDAEKIFNHYDLNDWKNSRDKPVKNWQRTIANNWFKPENKINMKNELERIGVTNFLLEYGPKIYNKMING